MKTKRINNEVSADLDFNSLERIVPDEIRTEGITASETLKLHIERYRFARENLIMGTLLDMACGVGYGTMILAADNPIISAATGVDISQAAIDYARGRYQSDRVRFLCDDALVYSSGDQFDNIVSLETVEHVDDPQALFARFSVLLAPGGRLISSVPVTPSVDANPHHRNNFTATTFQNLANPHPLKLLDRMNQIQPFSPMSLARKSELRANSLRHNMMGFYVRHPSHFLLRMLSTITDGFNNKYLTLVWEKASLPSSDIVAQR